MDFHQNCNTVFVESVLQETAQSDELSHPFTLGPLFRRKVYPRSMKPLWMPIKRHPGAFLLRSTNGDDRNEEPSAA